jgi:hypothetical protein
MIALPSYIDRDAWEGFEAMRKACKKPLTHRAAVLILKELQKLKDAGHDPNAALDQSTNHCWADVYQPKEKPIEAAVTKQVDETARYLAEQAAHRQKALRRVA